MRSACAACIGALAGHGPLALFAGSGLQPWPPSWRCSGLLAAALAGPAGAGSARWAGSDAAPSSAFSVLCCPAPTPRLASARNEVRAPGQWSCRAQRRAAATAPEPTSRPLAAALGRARHSSRYDVALLGVLVLALAFYMWTAASSIPFTFPSVDTGRLQRAHHRVPARSHVPPDHAARGTAASRRSVQPGAERPLQRRLPRPCCSTTGTSTPQWGPTPVLTLFAPFRIKAGQRDVGKALPWRCMRG